MNGKDTALFSKASDEWSTPAWLFDLLDREFHFDYDAACKPENCKTNYGIYDSVDSLDTRWTWLPLPVGYARTFWLNPPYSQIAAFMKKAYEESQKGATVVWETGNFRILWFEDPTPTKESMGMIVYHCRKRVFGHLRLP